MRKVWISQEHMKLDMFGMDSPGPAVAYQIPGTMGKQVHSTAESPAAWVFGSAKRTEVEPGRQSSGLLDGLSKTRTHSGRALTTVCSRSSAERCAWPASAIAAMGTRSAAACSSAAVKPFGYAPPYLSTSCTSMHAHATE